MTPGFKPVTVEVTAEGIIPLFRLPEAARTRAAAGLVTGAPSYAFKWTGETPTTCTSSFEGDGDSTLMVVGAGNKQVLLQRRCGSGQPEPCYRHRELRGRHVSRLRRPREPEEAGDGKLTVTEAAKE